MATPYDKDKNKDQDALKPDTLRDLEHKYSTHQDEAEDNGIEGGASADNQPRGGTGRELPEHGQARQQTDEQDEEEALSKRFGEGWKSAKDEDKSFYKKSGTDGRFRGILGRKKLLFGLGIGGSLAAGGILIFFGFLNVFKLDHIMSNIDSRTFARLHGVQDRRSLAWQRAYFKMRLMDMGNNADMTTGSERNLMFRANRVSTSSPIADWYRTLRTSRFEADLLEKHGIKFTSVLTADGKVRPGRIDIRGQKPIPLDFLKDSDITRLQNGDIEIYNRYSNFIDTEVFGTDKQARRAIRQAVNENTHWAQVFTRRHTRKAIQNMTGVRDWRFFEDKRNKFDEKKIDIRNKIIAKAVPESTKSGKFVHCLFGISDCKFSRDPAAPENRAEGTLLGSADVKEGKPLKNLDEGDPSQLHPNPDVIDLSQGADAAKKITTSILSKVNPALSYINLIATLDILSDINKAFEGGKISKGVAVARGVQAMGLYQVFNTARDQIRTGEVQGAEVNAFMDTIGPVTNNESYTSVIDGGAGGSISLFDPKVMAASPMTREAYCSPEHQAVLEKDRKLAETEFTYVCPGKQIGGGTRAKSLEDAWNKSIGNVLNPILGAYNGVRELPIVGKVIDEFFSLWNKVADAILGTAVNVVLSTLGLADDAAKAVEWLMGKTVAFLGAGPIMTGNEAAGETMNWLVQGGAYTAEATARTNGASLTTAESALLAEKTVAWHTRQQDAEKTVAEKYFSLANADSFAANTAFSISQLSLSGIGTKIVDFGSLFKTFIGFVSSPFSLQAGAANNNPYSAAELAGIATYDFPQQCYDLDPLSATPSSGTNIRQVISGIPEIELTWELVTNSDEWYNYVYEKLGDTDDASDKAEQIYNCHLLDTSIRGSLGYLYGYEDDNGLEEHGEHVEEGEPAGEPVEVPGVVNGKLPLVAPPNFDQNKRDRFGYYQMPPSLDGAYRFENFTPASERYGQKELIYVLYTVAQEMRKRHPKAVMNIGDLNAVYGHASHKVGRDVDLDMSGIDGTGNPFFAADRLQANYSKDITVELGSLFLATGLVDQIFWCADNSCSTDLGDGSSPAMNEFAKKEGLPGIVTKWPNHANHFHVRLRLAPGVNIAQ